MIHFHIIVGDIFGLLETHTMVIVISFTFKIVHKLDTRAFTLIRVIKNHSHYILNHLILLLIGVASPEIPISKILGLILCVVRVEPNPNFSILIDHNLLLRDIKSANFIVQFFIPIEHGHRTVEVIGVGDVLVLA